MRQRKRLRGVLRRREHQDDVQGAQPAPRLRRDMRAVRRRDNARPQGQGADAHSHARPFGARLRAREGINAVYEMAEIIERVETLNKKLTDEGDPHGTIVLSNISCVTASLNAVPSECEIYLDRRLVLGRDGGEGARRDGFSRRGQARDVGDDRTLRRTSWTGAPLVYEPLHMAWKIEDGSPLKRAADEAAATPSAKRPRATTSGTSARTPSPPVSMGIPTIGFGPGEYKARPCATRTRETSKISKAAEFYAAIIGRL